MNSEFFYFWVRDFNEKKFTSHWILLFCFNMHYNDYWEHKYKLGSKIIFWIILTHKRKRTWIFINLTYFYLTSICFDKSRKLSAKIIFCLNMQFYIDRSVEKFLINFTKFSLKIPSKIRNVYIILLNTDGNKGIKCLEIMTWICLFIY